MGLMFFDSHCHLSMEAFQGDRDAVIMRARKAGVTSMVTICVALHEVKDLLAIAEKYEDITCSIGVHPHEAEKHQDVTLQQLLDLCQHEKVVAIGETGLDYYYQNSPKDAQKRLFALHCAAAQESGLPLIVHSRNAEEDTAAMIRTTMREKPYKGLLHCFSSKVSLAKEALTHGFYVSFSGIVTFKNAKEVRDAVECVPLNRLLIETDAPYLAPVPNRGQRNEPAFVVHTARELARLKKVPLTQFAKSTMENFHTLFHKIARPQEQGVEQEAAQGEAQEGAQGEACT